MKEKTLDYRFVIEHINGKLNTFTDTLSRYPSLKVDKEDKELVDELNICSISMLSACSDRMELDLAALKLTAESDPEYQALLHKILNDNFAKSRNLEDPLVKPYYVIRDRISIVDGLLLYCFEDGYQRIVIPSKHRSNILNTLHSAHQGADGILRRARHTCIGLVWKMTSNEFVHNVKNALKMPLQILKRSCYLFLYLNSRFKMLCLIYSA